MNIVFSNTPRSAPRLPWKFRISVTCLAVLTLAFRAAEAAPRRVSLVWIPQGASTPNCIVTNPHTLSELEGVANTLTAQSGGNEVFAVVPAQSVADANSIANNSINTDCYLICDGIFQEGSDGNLYFDNTVGNTDNTTSNIDQISSAFIAAFYCGMRGDNMEVNTYYAEYLIEQYYGMNLSIDPERTLVLGDPNTHVQYSLNGWEREQIYEIAFWETGNSVIAWEYASGLISQWEWEKIAPHGMQY